MAEKRSRLRFTAEFKAQAVRRLLDGDRGLSEVATELGLSTGQLSTWRAEHLAAGSAEALAVRKAEEAETQRLKREVKRLEEENLILRKAAVFFAKGIAGRRSRSCRPSGATTPWRRCAGSLARA
jgi:transposase